MYKHMENSNVVIVAE